MPNPYEVYTTAGKEVSSTYEGRHVTLGEALLNHPTHADGLVDGKDPVVFGTVSDGWGVGVAFESASSVNDPIAIDTEGIWPLNVVAADDAGNSAIRLGDPLFINRTTCVISKIRNQATNIPFGYALTTATGDGASHVIVVKVHWMLHDLVVGMFNTLTSGSYGWSFRGILTDGQSEGVNGYVQGDLYGTSAGHTYGFGSWLNLQTAYVATGGHIHTPFEGGIWSADAQAALRAYFGGQSQAILAGAPAELIFWRLNTNQTIDALFMAANPGSIGYVAGVATTSNKVGDIPFASIVGPGLRWIRVYDAAG